MPITYVYDPAENVVLAEAIGTVSVQDLLNYMDAVSNDLNVKKDFIEIVNLSGVTDMDITYENAQELSNSWDDLKNRLHNGSIIYAPTDLTYGTLRMMQGLMKFQPDCEEKLYLVTRSQDTIPKLMEHIRCKQESLCRSVNYWQNKTPKPLTNKNI